MAAIFQDIIQSITQMQAWELVAVVLAIAYLLLAMKESLWCWYCAFFSTIIYTVLFWEVNLFMDSALQIYYLLMAVYGWWQWRGKNSDGENSAPALPITSWAPRQHIYAGAAIVLVSTFSGYLLEKNTSAAWPYLDSFTTWASVLTTYMVAKKILENWLYWIVIDGVAAALYVERGLYFTALLCTAYVIIVIFGYFSWRKDIVRDDYATA